MHLNERLAPRPAYGWEGGPEFRTQVVELNSGKERRNASWALPRHRYSASFNNITKEAYQEIRRLFLLCRGQLHAFRFRDELDNYAEQEIFALGDGNTKKFQLCKKVFSGGVTQTRNIFLLPSSPVIRSSGFVVSSGVTVDLLRGTVEFEVAPPNNAVLDWTGGFEVWVRFTQDYLPFTLDNPNATNGTVELMEVPPPAEEETL